MSAAIESVLYPSSEPVAPDEPLKYEKKALKKYMRKLIIKSMGMATMVLLAGLRAYTNASSLFIERICRFPLISNKLYSIIIII